CFVIGDGEDASQRLGSPPRFDFVSATLEEPDVPFREPRVRRFVSFARAEPERRLGGGRPKPQGGRLARQRPALGDRAAAWRATLGATARRVAARISRRSASTNSSSATEPRTWLAIDGAFSIASSSSVSARSAAPETWIAATLVSGPASRRAAPEASRARRAS